MYAPPIPIEALALSMAFHERQRRDAGHAFLRALLIKAMRAES